MLASHNKELTQRQQFTEIERGISDEQKRKDIAEEEFEVSSCYSPVDSYSPRFLEN